MNLTHILENLLKTKDIGNAKQQILDLLESKKYEIVDYHGEINLSPVGMGEMVFNECLDELIKEL